MGTSGEAVGGGASRRWLMALGALALVLMFVGAQPWDHADAAPMAQAATHTPTATQTFTVLWTVPDRTTGNQLRIDPFSQQFQITIPGRTPIAAVDTAMRYSRKQVTWKWSDASRACDATPPAGRSGRCPVFVWGNIDRVRHTVNVTVFERNRTGASTVSYVRQPSTPLPLPTAADPFVTIQDFRFVPKTKILLNNLQRVSFQNDSQLAHHIVFSRDPGKDDATNGRRLSNDTGPNVARGRSTAPYPVLVATLTPGVGNPSPTPQEVWVPGTYFYQCTIHPVMTGRIVVPA